MRRGQGAVCGGSDDLEGGAEGVEPPGGQLGGAGGELQQTRQLLLGEAGDHGPEPLHHLERQQRPDNLKSGPRRWGGKREAHFPATYFLSEVPRSADDHGVRLEVLHVYVTGAAHQQLRR